MKIIFTLLFLITVGFATQAQVNGYASVNTIIGKKLTINGSNETYGQFRKNGYVIIMQMQDNVIGGNLLNDLNFGNLFNIASAGEYEIARISTVKRDDSDPDDDDDDNNSPILEVKLVNNLAKNFITGLNSTVQIITFPTLGTNGFATVSDITAIPWNGSYGGVVAFDVNGVLTLNHNVHADNAGFRGGAMDASSSNYGLCSPLTFFSPVGALFGNKGEGIYKSINPLFVAGKGKIANGGGGGNTINGGGSGGGNYTAGGNGGAGWSCAANTGGIGGISLSTHVNGSRIFMGGGGGSGESNDYNDDRGGNGGGIVLVRAIEIRTTGTGAVRISANGQAGNSVSNDGAGGGGAGGSLLLMVANWNVSATKPLTIAANGGNGGSVSHGDNHGGGGGGGQGAALFNTPVPMNNTTVTTSNGIGGFNRTGGTRADDGVGTNNTGIMQTSFSLLPLKLVTFQAFKSDIGVELNWKTENEINVSHFEIERSADGAAFEVIGKRKALANNQATATYNHIDQHPLTGTNYYRLRIVDVDGKFTFSKVLVIRSTVYTNQSIGVYPNPAVSQATLSFKSEKSGQATVHILNMKGMMVGRQTTQVAAGENVIALTGVGHLPAGVYNVQVITNNTSNYARLIVQK